MKYNLNHLAFSMSMISDKITEAHPWRLVWGQPYIDSNRLASAIAHELLRNSHPDYRTRLLIKDSVQALKRFHPEVFIDLLNDAGVKPQIEAILSEEIDEVGFHYIEDRLVTNIKRNELEQVFELLGRNVTQPTEVCIAGSIPTIISELTARPTDDIDFIDEVPQVIREQRELLEQIGKKYGLTVGHVQSHYLPNDWQQRRQFLGQYGQLKVYVADEYDIFVSKLSSKLEKHQDDLRVMAAGLDKGKIRERLASHGKSFLDSPFDRPTIESNWQFIFREPLALDAF